jgi:hypothetical protein
LNYTFDKRFSHGAKNAEVISQCVVCARPWERYAAQKKCKFCRSAARPRGVHAPAPLCPPPPPPPLTHTHAQTHTTHTLSDHVRCCTHVLCGGSEAALVLIVTGVRACGRAGDCGVGRVRDRMEVLVCRPCDRAAKAKGAAKVPIDPAKLLCPLCKDLRHRKVNHHGVQG